MTAFTVTPKYTNELPESVKIGPIIFTVVQEKEPTAKDPEGNEIPVFGKIFFKKAIITIDEDLEPATKWQCFWHEVLHGILEMIGMAPQDGGSDEGMVDALAYALLALLIDNGWLKREDFPAQESTPVFAYTPGMYPYTLEKK